MKNNIFYLFYSIFFLLSFESTAKDLEVNSFKVKYDNINKITIFEGDVNAKDSLGNKLFSKYAKYNKIDGLFETQGTTKIVTSAGFEISGENIFLDEEKKIIYSNNKTQIIDKDGNKILVDMFNYSILTNIIFSKGNIKITDVNNNNYSFSEIYIDEKEKKIIGSDVKAFLNSESISSNAENEPRFFANTMSLNEKINKFDKGIFTYCKRKQGEKCPPWVLQSKKIKHDLAKKTIYYDNVVLKVYNFPIFFAPKFSHPDPTVKRMSGFLAPSFSSNGTVGNAIAAPYFWNIAGDKDITLTPKIYVNSNPLLLAEYRQDFMNSFLILDAGFTQGYKKTNNKKTSGSKSHLFANFNKTLIDEKEKKSSLNLKMQKVSNNTYLKVYEIDSLLVKEQTILENEMDYSYENNNFFLGLTPGMYENLSKTGSNKHEYLIPLSIDKGLVASERYGTLDLTSDTRIRSYDTNKLTKFLVNDFNWKSNTWLNKFGLESHFKGLLKTVNYKATNTKSFKNDSTNTEVNPALGFFTKLGLYKNDIANKNFQTLTPKFLLRYAPGHMRNLNGGRLNYGNLYDLKKVNELDVLENGLSSSIGFEYKKFDLDDKNNIGNEKFSFLAGQVVSAKENMDIPASTSIDQKFSDVVGKATYNINNKLNLNYNFSVDQNYKDLNYNEISSNFTFERTKFNVAYLQEQNHIGNHEHIQSGIDFKLNNFTELSVNTKRNLLTNSAEFYNLSYNYINDCLKAGLAYRREFYTDRDLEPTNSLMFTISIIPFAQINSPGLSK